MESDQRSDVHSSELVPGLEAVGLPLQLPRSAPADALGDLLSDALFGEVIDISDLIPRVVSPSPDAAALQPVAGVINGQDAGDVSAAANYTAGALTILYGDDILASDGTFL